jgi:hypothetical protein
MARNFKYRCPHHTIHALVLVTVRWTYDAVMNSLDSPVWRFFEAAYGYFAPDPPPRTREPGKPMQVLCVGLPRSGTESLQQALLILGYDHTYHVRHSRPFQMQSTLIHRRGGIWLMKLRIA